MLVRPVALGAIAVLILLGVYIGVVSFVSGWSYMLKQFAHYWYFVVTLAVGFGVQVGLFMYLRSLQQNARGVVAVSGTTTTVAMLSCCSHYVANLIPILGVAGTVTLIGQYQIEFFWFGIATNLFGIVYMMGKIRNVRIHAAILAIVLLIVALPVNAEEDFGEFQRRASDDIPNTFAQAEVVGVVQTTDPEYVSMSSIVQQVRVRLTSGDEKGTEVVAQNSIVTNAPRGFDLNTGEHVVVMKNIGPLGERYYVTDLYRITPLILILAVFLALVIFFGRMKGLLSFVGLVFSIIVLAKFIVPQILAGKDPFFVSLIGSVCIVTVAMYLAHGFERRTTIAYAGTLVTLGIAAILSALFVSSAKLLGTGSETALYVQFGADAVNLRGLLLGGILIGTLGVLDDITTAQSAVVDELKKANPSLRLWDLYARGISVGKEHIAALVNTLALAYAGAALPLFLLFSLNTTFPLWVTINGQDIAEEVIRTLVGSMALVLAVPITTLFAATYFSRKHPVVS